MIRFTCEPSVWAMVLPKERRNLISRLRRVMRAISYYDHEVGLVLSDNKRLQQLNHAYAQEDHPTDVLSFSQGSMQGIEPPLLGDIFISVEMASLQALEKQHEFSYELFFLAVHGLCHLLGYDHASSQEERIMFGLEALLREEGMKRGKTKPITLPSPKV